MLKFWKERTTEIVDFLKAFQGRQQIGLVVSLGGAQFSLSL